MSQSMPNSTSIAFIDIRLGLQLYLYENCASTIRHAFKDMIKALLISQWRIAWNQDLQLLMLVSADLWARTVAVLRVSFSSKGLWSWIVLDNDIVDVPAKTPQVSILDTWISQSCDSVGNLVHHRERILVVGKTLPIQTKLSISAVCREDTDTAILHAPLHPSTSLGDSVRSGLLTRM